MMPVAVWDGTAAAILPTKAPGIGGTHIVRLILCLCHSDRRAGRGCTIFQRQRDTFGFPLIALVAESVCKFVANRKIEQFLDGHMPYRAELHATNRYLLD